MMILMIMVMMVGLMQPMTETMVLKRLMQPMTDVSELWGSVAIAMYMKGASIQNMMRTMESNDYYDDSDDNGDGGADAADDGDDDAEGADAADDGCEGAMVMVLTATIAMTAMTTTMTMKMTMTMTMFLLRETCKSKAKMARSSPRLRKTTPWCRFSRDRFSR